MPAVSRRQQKITLVEMRASDARGVLARAKTWRKNVILLLAAAAMVEATPAQS